MARSLAEHSIDIPNAVFRLVKQRVVFSARRQAERPAPGPSHHVRAEHVAPGRRRQRKRDEQPYDGEDEVLGRPTHAESRKRGN